MSKDPVGVIYNVLNCAKLGPREAFSFFSTCIVLVCSAKQHKEVKLSQGSDLALVDLHL